MTQHSAYSALILAAGKGTRMKSSAPKVMQPLLEEPMLFYVIQSLKNAGITDIAAVVGHEGEKVEAWLSENAPDVKTIWQKDQLGTGHAVIVASEWIKSRDKILILNGDMPMLTEDEINLFFEGAKDSDVSFITIELQDPAQYGRVIRKDGAVAIVEAKDATPEELLVHEINVGVYLLSSGVLLEGLSCLTQNNSQKEYYIVDLISWACKRGLNVVPVKLPAKNLDGVNNPLELARLSEKIRDRIVAKWLIAGVKCIDPSSVWISPRAIFHGEAFLYPNVQIWGKTEIGDGCSISSGTILRNCVLKDNVQCLGYVVAQDVIAESGAQMGPFCFLRDGTHLMKDSFAGKFVEVKNSQIGEGAKVPHLSYMGDAVIGAGTNIGAASVTCNFDGEKKNRTYIGANCFIGSDTMFVAPVNVGDGALIGAGSVITKDVPGDALGIARARQKIFEGWGQKRNSRRKK